MTWDELRHFHRQPKAIAWWIRHLGPVLDWLQPARRRSLLVAGAVIVAVARPVMDLQKAGSRFGFEPGMLEALLVVLLLAAWLWVWYRAARQFRSLPAIMQRHPLLCLHGGFWLLLLALWTTGPAQPLLRGVLIGCAVALPFLLWRLGYLLLAAQRGRLAGTSLGDHLIYLWPPWGGTDTPYGKGHDYLKSVEARDTGALARSQLGGLKLFVLALVCAIGKDLIEGLVFGEDNGIRRALGGITLGIPTVDAQLLAPRGAHPLWTGWVALYCELFRLVLRMGANGHIIVGCLRLFGFDVFRNTYKPLLAETIVEFWNRYYFYFKELLVNTFFLPTFTRWFRQRPRLRLLAAVFAAAFFGNLYYHVLKSAPLVRGDWMALADMFNPRLTYCFLLATGIYLSMRRQQLRPGGTAPRSRPRRAVAILGVWTFFAVIHVWHRGEATFADRVGFVTGLVGVG